MWINVDCELRQLQDTSCGGGSPTRVQWRPEERITWGPQVPLQLRLDVTFKLQSSYKFIVLRYFGSKNNEKNLKYELQQFSKKL